MTKRIKIWQAIVKLNMIYLSINVLSGLYQFCDLPQISYISDLPCSMLNFSLLHKPTFRSPLCVLYIANMPKSHSQSNIMWYSASLSCKSTHYCVICTCFFCMGQVDATWLKLVTLFNTNMVNASWSCFDIMVANMLICWFPIVKIWILDISSK